MSNNRSGKDKLKDYKWLLKHHDELSIMKVSFGENTMSLYALLAQSVKDYALLADIVFVAPGTVANAAVVFHPCEANYMESLDSDTRLKAIMMSHILDLVKKGKVIYHLD